MEIVQPTHIGFFIYSKSGCPNCLKLKTTLRDKSLLYIDVNCDDYLVEPEDKETFISFIREKSSISLHTFPIVFFDGVYIGGYKEALVQIDKLMVCFEDNVSF